MPPLPTAGTNAARVPTDNPGVTMRAAAGGLVARFAGDASARAHVVLPRLASEAFTLTDAERPDVAVRVTARGARPVEARVEAGLVRYRGALGEGTEVFHRVTSRGTEDWARFAARPTTPEMTYDLTLGEAVAGLRMIGASLEMLDASGAPRLRVDRPYGVDANGERFDVEVALAGCDADRDPAPPFGRAVVAPGSRACAVTLRWSEDVAYPVVIDPAWTSAGDLAANNVSYEMHLAKNTGGRVLAVVAGNVAQLWDAGAGTWANTGTPTFAFGHRTRLVPIAGNKAFAINPSGAASIFDVGAGTWKASIATPTVDGNGVAAVDEGAGKVLVFDAIGRAYEYDVASDQYTAKTSAGRTIGGNLGVFKLTGTTLGFTGFGTNRVAIYDYATDKWAFPASNVLTGGAENCGNLELLTSGKVLAYGACGGANQANVFDPLADGVVPVPMPSTPSIYCQCGHTTSISYAKLHVIAGGRYVFDEDTGAITDSGAFASGAAHHGAVVKLDDGRALAAGGSVTYDNKATDVYGPSEAADCGAGSRFGGAAAPVFDATSKTCKACDGDNGGATPAKCPTAGRPLCRTTVTDPLRGQCTACSETSKALCTGTKPLCNTATGSCTG
jgi:hypothetical protein